MAAQEPIRRRNDCAWARGSALRRGAVRRAYPESKFLVGVPPANQALLPSNVGYLESHQSEKDKTQTCLPVRHRKSLYRTSTHPNSLQDVP